MNTFFIVLLFIYLSILVIMGIFDIKKAKTFNDFAVAGKKQKSFPVIMSILATVIGASTTIGIADTTEQIGFPAVWWLWFGSLGLILQSIFISKKVRSLNADTLPSVAGITVNKAAEIALGIIIVIAWVGVIAGQLVAMNGLVTFLLGKNSKIIFIIIAISVILYTTVGGQISVIKTDIIQFIIIGISVIATFIYLYFFAAKAGTSGTYDFSLVNEKYRPISLVTQFFIIGGVYFLGPDIMSRNLVSGNERTAKKSARISGISLFFYAILIVMIGMWAHVNIADAGVKDGSTHVLMYLMSDVIPKPIAVLLMIGLISALLSSIDTCIINASSIFVKNILRKDKVSYIRITVVVIGILALIFALAGNGDIISILSGAYSVYTPGVIFPLLISILVYNKRPLHKGIWLLAVILGGAFGLCGAYFPFVLDMLKLPEFIHSNFSLIGMGVSLVVSLLSVKWKTKENVKDEI